MGKRFRRKFENVKSGFRTAGEVASKALNIALKVKRLLNVEYKTIDTAVTNNSVSSTASVLPMNAIAQGDSATTRDGNSIKLMSLHIKYVLFENAAASATAVRMMIVKDLLPQGAVPAITDILVASDCVSPMNLLNSRRFKVLHKKDFGISTTGEDIRIGDYYTKLNFHTKYDGAGGAATDINNNGIYLILISNQVANLPTFQYASRIRFVDN